MTVVEINHEIQRLEHKIWLTNVANDFLSGKDKEYIDSCNKKIRELRKMLEVADGN